MQIALLSTYLLLAFLSPVISLTCSFCRNNSKSCENEVPQTCKSNEKCISGVLDNNIVDKYKVASYRGCAITKRCHSGEYSISSANGKYLQMKTSCCGTDKCNKEPRSVTPREDLSPNGLKCPGCFSLVDLGSAYDCQTEGNVSCLGNETKCIEFKGTIQYGSIYIMKMKLKGCATEDVCALNGKPISLSHLHLHRIITKCSNAKKSSEQIDSQQIQYSQYET